MQCGDLSNLRLPTSPIDPQYKYHVGEYVTGKNFIYLFFSNQVNLSQPRSVCFNLDQFGAGKKLRSQATSHRSLLSNTESIVDIH